MRFCRLFSLAPLALAMTSVMMMATLDPAQAFATNSLSYHLVPPFISSTRRINILHAQQDDGSDEDTTDETPDERINRLLMERIEQLDMATNDTDDTLTNETTQQKASFPQFRLGSLEILALVVSAFFVATVSLSNGALFASPPTTPRNRVVLDADEILKQDFNRDSSSVTFGVEDN